LEIKILSSKDGRKKIPKDEHCYTKLDQKAKFLWCTKGQKNGVKCDLMPTGWIGPDPVCILVDSLTVGDIKQLLGLDNVKVLKEETITSGFEILQTKFVSMARRQREALNQSMTMDFFTKQLSFCTCREAEHMYVIV
jgi:hypothetical protein